MITKDMRVCEVIDLNDEIENVLLKNGLTCSGCPGAAQETLEEATEGHGISIEKLLRELNQIF